MVNDCLIIKCNIKLTEHDSEMLREKIKGQIESGIVLLPSYCDALLVPKDTVIGWLNDDGFPAINMMENKHD